MKIFCAPYQKISVTLKRRQRGGIAPLASFEMKALQSSISGNTVLSNLYERQLSAIEKVVSALAEDTRIRLPAGDRQAPGLNAIENLQDKAAVTPRRHLRRVSTTVSDGGIKARAAPT